MKRRSRARSDPGKARRRKTVAPKRASASKAVPRRSSSAGDMEAKIGQLTIENARLVDELRQRAPRPPLGGIRAAKGRIGGASSH